MPRFRPARRVFSGRGRSLLTFGEWRLAFFSMAFGGALGAVFVNEPVEYALPFDLPGREMIAALDQPAPGPVLAGATPSRAEASTPVTAAAQRQGAAMERPDAPTAVRHFIAEAGRIVDGDTLYLEGLATRIRLWGVDAPESDEAGFDAASKQLAALVAGEILTCDEVDRDRYGRIVARCFTGAGLDVSRAMIASGVAIEYLRFTNGYYGGASR